MFIRSPKWSFQILSGGFLEVTQTASEHRLPLLDGGGCDMPARGFLVRGAKPNLSRRVHIFRYNILCYRISISKKEAPSC